VGEGLAAVAVPAEALPEPRPRRDDVHQRSADDEPASRLECVWKTIATIELEILITILSLVQKNQNNLGMFIYRTLNL
jgi:hypothetical protein